ncbi:MAG: response regulator [Candidatus Omnitrophica bacterium]|nr:response regulator [Candidatus Omnitrophota bacterium]
MSKILVVDDETEVRGFLHNVLSGEGYEVTTVPNGQEMFRMMKQQKYDLVILDQKLKGEEGITLLKQIPGVVGERIPVVLFSGHIDKDVEKEAYEAGAIEVISKGGALVELREKVRRIIAAKHRIFGEEDRLKRVDRILIVDDEEEIRGFLKGFFEDNGYKVFVAKDGEEALVRVQNEKLQVILLDITMPGMDGLRTLKKIRDINSNIGVVMATSVQDEDVIREATSLGAYGYVLKPFDLQYLEMVVLTRLEVAA